MEREAESQGIEVTDMGLPGCMCGVWDWKRRRIILHDRLNDVQRLCTLCHELRHAAHDDRQCGGKGEARARRETALALISPMDYGVAEQVWQGEAWGMACELGVTLQVLEDYRQALDAMGVRIM